MNTTKTQTGLGAVRRHTVAGGFLAPAREFLEEDAIECARRMAANAPSWRVYLGNLDLALAYALGKVAR